MNDNRLLKTLSVLHFACAGYFIGIGIFISRFLAAVIPGSIENLRDPSRVPNPSESLDSWGAVFGISALLILWWMIAICLVVAGRKLWKTQSRRCCLFIAATECLNVPIGTILGAVTLITLNRDSVKKRFAQQTHNPPEQTATS